MPTELGWHQMCQPELYVHVCVSNKRAFKSIALRPKAFTWALNLSSKSLPPISF